jgi:Hint domain
LAIGDRVVTQAGALRRVKWIGRRSYDGRFVAGRPEVLPILVKAGALADGVPRRDLMLSPHHALWFDTGVLVPVEHLLNGVSIVQVEAVDQVDYFHIELDSHDVILAEGAAAESFVDCDSRQMFHNAAEFVQLYPGAEPTHRAFCAPRIEDGADLVALWQRLARRAGITPASGPLLGCLDEAGAAGVLGWARDAAHPGVPVLLEIVVDGVVVGRVPANRYRADLAAAGYGLGRHGFAFAPAGGHVIAVRRACDGAELAQSPRRLAAG